MSCPCSGGTDNCPVITCKFHKRPAIHIFKKDGWWTWHIRKEVCADDAWRYQHEAISAAVTFCTVNNLRSGAMKCRPLSPARKYQ